MDTHYRLSSHLHDVDSMCDVGGFVTIHILKDVIADK
jgi:hypothetical protein